MNYKKIVFSLVLMSLNSLIVAMDLPGILVTNSDQQAKRRVKLSAIAAERRAEIANNTTSGESSPKAVAEIDDNILKKQCSIGSFKAKMAVKEFGKNRSEKAAELAIKKAVRLDIEVNGIERNISLARRISVLVPSYKIIHRLSVKSESSIEEID